MASSHNCTFVQNYRSAVGLNLRNCSVLDSESTVHDFCNRNLVEKVWESEDSMTIVSYGGEFCTKMRCTMKNLDPKQPIWFHQSTLQMYCP